MVPLKLHEVSHVSVATPLGNTKGALDSFLKAYVCKNYREGANYEQTTHEQMIKHLVGKIYLRVAKKRSGRERGDDPVRGAATIHHFVSPAKSKPSFGTII